METDDVHEMEKPKMIEVRKQRVALYVDRSSQQWVVLDPDGNFWLVPSGDNPWDQHSRFSQPR